MKIAFIRMRYDPFGGSELFTQLLIERLCEKGFEVHIFTRDWIDPDASPLNFTVHHIRGWQGISLLGQLTFIYRVQKALKHWSLDLIQSHERTVCQDIYRAGDGVHAQWLKSRMARMGFLRKASVVLNPRHLLLLLLEKRIFKTQIDHVLNNNELQESQKNEIKAKIRELFFYEMTIEKFKEILEKIL